jgi:uncharacterized cupredoxin-like copper-binding protein
MPGQSRLRHGLLSSAVLCAVLVLCASACGGTGQGAAAGSTVVVTERDFQISAPTHVAAGLVDLHVENRGPDAHELIVVRARDKGLPLRSDGLTANEEALAKTTVGVLEPGRSGEVRDLRLRLRPGRYVLFCNMSGHFLSGMQHVLVVT